MSLENCECEVQNFIYVYVRLHTCVVKCGKVWLFPISKTVTDTSLLPSDQREGSQTSCKVTHKGICTLIKVTFHLFVIFLSPQLDKTDVCEFRPDYHDYITLCKYSTFPFYIEVP